MRILAALVMLLALTATYRPPTREEVEKAANGFVKQCRAEHLLAVTVESPEVVRIKPLKEPATRTEADLAALRCLGRQRSALIDFRPLADALLTMRPPG
ncbi:hypothetical protein [Erythrobacter donghaensis]|jgi:hypothetical protein|uniref:hypothetical protein n=1 Tax=Erythrobacter donghaensis TaxID=267135 RepID=UPI00093F6C38|nr:hypothetical protein [Erythrobacter donghaensis]